MTEMQSALDSDSEASQESANAPGSSSSIESRSERRPANPPDIQASMYL